MIGSLAVTNKRKALEELQAASDQLVALAESMAKRNFYLSKEHVEAAWRCIQFAMQAAQGK